MIPSRNRHLTGFSLVELLVVILIISLLLTLGAGVMKSISGGNSLGSAIATSEALFDEARAIAVGKGTRARVLVDVKDPQNEETYLRRMVLCYEELDPQGEPIKDKWVLSSRGQNLPEKTFFSKEYSKLNHETGTGDMKEEEYSFEKDMYSGKYISYEFNSEGICTTPGTSFVIGSGIRPLGEAPRTAPDGKRDFGGFVVWRNGRTSLFRDPEQIGIPAQVTTF